MTIAQAFNEIAVAQGGTAATDGMITSAIDALNDALAGADQEAAQTIEEAVRLLGSHIGGGSSVTVEALTATENKTYTAPEGKAYSPVTVNVSGGSSDYSTAKVIFGLSDYTGEPFSLGIPVINSFDDSLEGSINSGDMDGETEFNVVLYKGKLFASLPVPLSASTTGDIEFDDDLYITGNGTVIFSDEEE